MKGEIKYRNRNNEYRIANAIDKNILVTNEDERGEEYKYGPTSITKEAIIKQFIERDLFNPDITSINQIQWRLKETGLTKTQLHNWLISNDNECRTAIKKLGEQKIALLLDDNSILQLTKQQAASKLIEYLNIDANFNLIFR